MKRLLYLEPYTFAFIGEKEAVIYNTLNSAYIHANLNHPVVRNIIDTLNNPDNGYGIILDDKELENPEVKSFIYAVRESFSGDLVPFKEGSTKPFIFKPAPYMNNLVEDEDDPDNSKTAGELALQNLCEVTLFLPVNNVQSDDSFYHLQMNHPYNCHNENQLQIEDYATVLHQLFIAGVNRVNVVGTDQLLAFNHLFGNSDTKLYYYTSLSSSIPEQFQIDKPLEIFIHPEEITVETAENIKIHHRDGIVWNFILTSITDVERVDKLNLPEHIDYKYTPYYDGSNMPFFEQHVFNGLDDIIAKPVSRKAIFRRQLLNENFFGKLWIDAAGHVYGNMNCAPVGNIRNGSLKDMATKLLVEKQFPWLLTREIEPCKHCVNRYLCPSVSNYELVMNRYNLCHVK
jgi:pseudo-rSAM protein